MGATAGGCPCGVGWIVGSGVGLVVGAGVGSDVGLEVGWFVFGIGAGTGADVTTAFVGVFVGAVVEWKQIGREKQYFV